MKYLTSYCHSRKLFKIKVFKSKKKGFHLMTNWFEMNLADHDNCSRRIEGIPITHIFLYTINIILLIV